MKKLLLSVSLIALSTNTVWAQDFYGYIGATAQINHVDNIVNDPAVGGADNEPFDFNQYGVAGAFGMDFANGFYGQIDFRYQKTDVPSNADDVLHEGSLIALRGGKDFGAYNAGGFIGYVDITGDRVSDNRKMQRVVYGIDGTYAISNSVSLFGELGGIGGPMGDQGTGGDDGIHDAYYAITGLEYALSPALALAGQVGYARGTHDNDRLDLSFAGVAISYQTNVPGLSTYLRADYTNFYQFVEDDGLASTTVQLGLNYAFGAGSASANRLRPLAPYEDWLGYSGGHLE